MEDSKLQYMPGEKEDNVCIDLEASAEDRLCTRKNGAEAVVGMFHNHWIFPVKLNQNKFKANSVKIYHITNLNTKVCVRKLCNVSRENNVIDTE